jgi:hypothetical protein
MWREAKRVELFLNNVEQGALLLNEPEKENTLKRLSSARKLLGSTDINHYFDMWDSPDD